MKTGLTETKVGQVGRKPNDPKTAKIVSFLETKGKKKLAKVRKKQKGGKR